METGRNLKYPVHMSDAELNACRDIALSSNTSRTVKKMSYFNGIEFI